jgi:hypothetical protein
MKHILCILCVAGFSSAGMLLTNGDFEQVLTAGWQQANSGSYVYIDRSVSYDPDADYEARAEKGDGSGYAKLFQTVAIPTTDLEFSCNAKMWAYDNHSTAWCGAAVRIFYVNASNTILGETMICMRSTQNPWNSTSTRHVIPVTDSLWYTYAFNIDDELANLPGVNPSQIARIQVALYDTCYDC